ncbi:CFEM domain-containing protein [Colletotrichum graminicola]|uniref:CFEM domain-containing protein n=1 Tax=Colletotrichum graminicola (strain M1.001 / M2 / FGSC 10212) TaxID=645133 RepID=E3QUK5_COLGM|nr:CFEM domain-containing protein [Colletotrichum graminicola M1.001]EFQ34543.1 CFEM domain-containing protein [Colletotrichum graminicola M1.001]WDK22624.1 CFEM domain-containing protein [Colletotrichum graminicola]
MRDIIGIATGLALLLGGATAADNCASVAVTAIPSCAQSCFTEGASFVGCDSLDFSCQCGKEAALYAAIEPCVATGCPAASFQAVINGASSVCGCAGAGQIGGQTISGSFVSAISGSGIGSSPATASATHSGSGGSPFPASATQGGSGGDGWNPPPTTTPFSTSSPVNAAELQSGSKLKLLYSIVGMAIAVAMSS